MMLMAIFFSMLVILVLMVLAENVKYFFKYQTYDKSTPFESGFSVFSFGHSMFSIRFFLLAVIFLVFDIELLLIFPLVYMNIFVTKFSLLIFLSLLSIGMFFEWKKGALNWAI